LLAERDGHGVMAREANVLATAFHPELTNDDRVHHYFLDMVQAEPGTRAA
jgi:5'-phosphate synthase pdxT subunit